MKTHTPVRLLGIDPGYDRVGWAVGELQAGKVTLMGFGCIETNKKQLLLDRYQTIDEQLSHILTNYHPLEAGVETLFFSKNQTTAMQVSEARGVIISALFRHQVAIHEYNPMQIKQAVTGSGKADKVAVEKMVRLQLQIPVLASQKSLLDDTLDAMAILMTHAASRALKRLH